MSEETPKFSSIVSFDKELPDWMLEEKIVQDYAGALDTVIEFEPQLMLHAANVRRIMRERNLAGERSALNARQVSADLMADNNARGQVIEAQVSVGNVHKMFGGLHKTFGHWVWKHAQFLLPDVEAKKITINDKESACGLVLGEGNHYLNELEEVLDTCKLLVGQVDSTGFSYKDSIEVLKRDREMEVK